MLDIRNMQHIIGWKLNVFCLYIYTFAVYGSMWRTKSGGQASVCVRKIRIETNIGWMCAAHHETNGKRCNAHTNKRKNARKLTSVEKRMAEGKTSKIYVFFPWKGEKKTEEKTSSQVKWKQYYSGKRAKTIHAMAFFPSTHKTVGEREKMLNLFLLHPTPPAYTCGICL